jgi:transcription elongation GreA/GreB family factor
MSRAFVKESEDALPELPELPLSPHPNHVTARGLRQLRERLAANEAALAALAAEPAPDPLHRAHLAREGRWLGARIQSALPADPAVAPRDRVAFGSTVDVLPPDGTRHRYRIVGEDEADPEHELVSWLSPLARALLGARVGDTVVWRRPAGDLEIEVAAIEPPAQERAAE